MDVAKNLEQEARKKEISIRPYNVIYKLVDDVKKELSDRLPQVEAEEVIGTREKEGEGERERNDINFYFECIFTFLTQARRTCCRSSRSRRRKRN